GFEPATNSLEGCDSTPELLPHFHGGEWRIRTSVGQGPADLQSAAFDRSANSPSGFPSGAGDGTRTRDLLITNQLLYQLSYASDDPFSKTHRPFYRRCRDGACAAAAEELRVIANGLTGRKRSLIP